MLMAREIATPAEAFAMAAAGTNAGSEIAARYRAAAAWLEVNGSDDARMRLKAHTNAIAKGCPCRWRSHWQAVIDIEAQEKVARGE